MRHDGRPHLRCLNLGAVPCLGFFRKPRPARKTRAPQPGFATRPAQPGRQRPRCVDFNTRPARKTRAACQDFEAEAGEQDPSCLPGRQRPRCVESRAMGGRKAGPASVFVEQPATTAGSFLDRALIIDATLILLNGGQTVAAHHVNRSAGWRVAEAPLATIRDLLA